MRRFAALLAALALALLCAGGFAMPSARAESAEPTQPPLRHVLDIRFSVSPAALVEPGAVTLTFTIANTSEYDAENVYISSSDGLRTEPLGQIEAGDSRTFSRAHDVTEAELEAGRITYIFSHDGVANDPDTVNYTVDCPIERAIARGEVEFTRQFSAAYARPGDVVTITYRVRNAGNVPIENIRVDDAPGEYSGRADRLDVGETRLFISRVSVEDVTTSAPQLRYTVPAEGGGEREVTLSEARILLADEQLTATLALDRETARVGETVTATLTVMSLGNVSFYDLAVYDERFGGLVADSLEMEPGTQTLTIQRQYPVRGDATYQLRVRALSSSGAVIETLTEPVSLRALPAESGADISIYAEAVYPQIAAAGEVPVDVYILNEGGESARDAVLSELSTGTQLRAFDFLAARFTTHRRVYVPVSQTGELTFSVRYVNAAGVACTVESPPVLVEIARGGQRLDQIEESAPYSGQSVKISENPTFLFMLGGAALLLIALAVALLITSRKQRRQRREKLEKQRRQRQEELGKTNRFTPVRAAQRKAEKPKGEKDGQP